MLNCINQLLKSFSLSETLKVQNLLNISRHSIKLPSRFVSVHPWINRALRLSQRSIFVQGSAVNRSSCLIKVKRMRVSGVTDWTSISHRLDVYISQTYARLPRAQEPLQGRSRETVRARGWEDASKTVSSGPARTAALGNSQQLRLPTKTCTRASQAIFYHGGRE